MVVGVYNHDLFVTTPIQGGQPLPPVHTLRKSTNYFFAFHSPITNLAFTLVCNILSLATLCFFFAAPPEKSTLKATIHYNYTHSFLNVHIKQQNATSSGWMED